MSEVEKARGWTLLWFAVPEERGYSEIEWTQEETDAATSFLKAVRSLTWEDVDKLRNLAPSGLQEYEGFEGRDPQEDAASFLRDLADRIEALLPPRDEEES